MTQKQDVSDHNACNFYYSLGYCTRYNDFRVHNVIHNITPEQYRRVYLSKRMFHARAICPKAGIETLLVRFYYCSEKQVSVPPRGRMVPAG